MNPLLARIAIRLGGASLVLLLMLSSGLLVLLLSKGFSPFWPAAIVQIEVRDGEETSQWLGRIVEQSDAGLVLHLGDGFESERYRRIDTANLVAISEPVSAWAVRSADGMQRYGDGRPDLADGEVAHQPNAMSMAEKLLATLGGFFSFVSGGPERGGMLPALLGTVTLVLLMSVVVMPVGIAAAIWLNEYAGNRLHERWVRGALASLAGVPTIVYGVFGLGLFVHIVGGGLDRWLYADRLPAPTFGSGGLLWAALTLAMLTLPIVVVSIEQGLSRIPRSLRDASLALGATRHETLRHVVLPMARPVIVTALIVAMARACGAVAPLMLVGVVKWAPSLPLNGEFPYLHPSRQFMHLGFSIYDSAFASNDAYDGVAQAWSSALLLVLLVTLLNCLALLLRRRLSAQQRQFDVELPA